MATAPAVSEQIEALRATMDAVRAEADAMRTLERGLAFTHALTTIETNCAPVGDDVFSLDGIFPEAEDAVREAVTYLEWRGLLARGSANAQHVMVLDECEATR